MLPGKAEKRIASSVFITLVPPRREVVTKEKTQRELQCFAKGCVCRQEGMWVFWGVIPQIPAPIPGWIRLLGKGCVCSPSPGAYRGCLSAWPRRRLLLGQVGECCRKAVGVLLDVITPLNPPRLVFTTETRSVAPVPSSSPVLILSEAPQPLSAEALGPALQQLDLAAPATLQLRSVGSSPVGETEAHSTEPLSLPPADICAFCHKAVGPREPTVEAMRKQYHADCFTCRTCHRLLAGQRYYQKDGRPTCDACYQVTLEKCAKCRGLITERVVRALGKGYHPGCFSCTACGRAIGTESFAVGERDEVYCVADFYRKYAAVCSACEHPIIPHEDKDTYKIECLGRSFHESCYRCESCGTPLSPEPTENGCYPLDDRLLCKSCHVRWRNESSC
uniref:Filamin binding LIM protein 1 n=1 Tax=Bubo bubo TaxID=30461 RepID=A0A8C0EI92_BUBBB